MDDPNIEADSLSRFETKLRGVHKWCVVNKINGDVIKKDMAKKSEAQKYLEEYEVALKS